MAFQINDPMEITHIPFESLEGKIYRGSMPWTINKKDDDTITRLKTANIGTIVLLVTKEESHFCLGCDLKELYEQKEITVEHFPINHADSLSVDALSELISKIEIKASEGQNVLIHCVEGKRRTGCVIACLAAKILKLSTNDAIKKVQHDISEDITLEKFRTIIKAFSPISDDDSSEESLSSTSGPMFSYNENSVGGKKQKKCGGCVIF